MRFKQSMSVHYQAISHNDNSNLKFTVFLYIKSHKISKKLITEVHRSQQTVWQELSETEAEEQNICSDSLTVYLSL